MYLYDIEWNDLVKKIPPLLAEAIVKSIRRVYSKCAELNLKCTDPPCVISPLLKCLGYNEYQVRRFWSILESLGSSISLEIYRHSLAHFNLVLSYRKETVMHLRNNCIPLDEIDCLRLGSECIKTPHAHALYVYIDGRIEHTSIRVNVIRALYFLYLKNPRIVDELMNALIDVIWERGSPLKLYNMVLSALNIGSSILQLILPIVPGNIRDLLRLSPILRKISSSK